MTSEEANAACASIFAPVLAWANCKGYADFAARARESKTDDYRFVVPMLREQVDRMTADDIEADRLVEVEFLVDYGDAKTGERHSAYRTEAELMVQQGACRLCTG